MAGFRDGPASPQFDAVSFKGNRSFKKLAAARWASKELKANIAEAPRGSCVCWGLPFQVKQPLVARKKPVEIPLDLKKLPN